MNTRNIELRIEDGMDRRDVYATTYQLRNLYHQFRDGAIQPTDGFNLMNLMFAADLCPKGGRVLDMCCGRGLLIPFLRYRSGCELYVGVDIEPKNAIWKDGRDPRRRGNVEKEGGWGFDTVFVEASVEEMAEPIRTKLDDPEVKFDLVTFTSSIEHMQPEAQRRSLHEAAAVAHEGTVMYLTCPITEEGRSGYDAQYSAHVYEPTESELSEWFADAGWEVERSRGLLTKVTAIKERLMGRDLDRAMELRTQLPKEFAMPFIATLFPECATEMGYICRPVG